MVDGLFNKKTKRFNAFILLLLLLWHDNILFKLTIFWPSMTWQVMSTLNIEVYVNSHILWKNTPVFTCSGSSTLLFLFAVANSEIDQKVHAARGRLLCAAVISWLNIKLHILYVYLYLGHNLGGQTSEPF